jgi:hypothetical protein
MILALPVPCSGTDAGDVLTYTSSIGELLRTPFSINGRDVRVRGRLISASLTGQKAPRYFITNQMRKEFTQPAVENSIELIPDNGFRTELDSVLKERALDKRYVQVEGVFINSHESFCQLRCSKFKRVSLQQFKEVNEQGSYESGDFSNR